MTAISCFAVEREWFVLVIGIAIGTIDDILYNYVATLGVYSFGDFSNVL